MSVQLALRIIGPVTGYELDIEPVRGASEVFLPIGADAVIPAVTNRLALTDSQECQEVPPCMRRKFMYSRVFS